MDERSRSDERFDELLEKRRRMGLSDDEADELGRLMAEREGRGEEWTSARLERLRREGGTPG